MKLILLLINKGLSIVLITIILLIFACIRKEWENPFDSEDTLEHEITIISPNGKTDIERGITYTIKWLSKNVTENINIALYKNNSSDLNDYIILLADSIPNNNNGDFSADSLVESTFSWKVPWNLNDIKLTDSTNLYIKIFSAVDPKSAFDVSDDNFDLLQPTIVIRKPQGGDEWYIGLPAIIEWISSKDQDDVRIELMKGSKIIKTIVESFICTNETIYNNWIIPEDLTPDTLYTLKITSNINPNLKIFRNNIFIKKAPDINITNPKFDNRWVIGQEYLITWDSDSLMKHTPNIRIECLKDSSVLDTIVVDTLNKGEFIWQIPWKGYIESKNYQIKIISIYNESIYDMSGNFEIEWPDIEITYPNVGTIVRSGDQETIRWNTIEYIPNIWIFLYNGPYRYPYDSTKVYRIEQDAPNIGEYLWNIKWDLEKSNQYWIRVACPLNYAICDTSEYFTIALPDIQSVSPTEWITLQKGQDYTINWINYEFPDTSHVGIELWKDGGVRDVLNSNDILNIGEFDWKNIKYEYESGDGYQIKVYCIENSKIERMSNRFKIID